MEQLSFETFFDAAEAQKSFSEISKECGDFSDLGYFALIGQRSIQNLSCYTQQLLSTANEHKLLSSEPWILCRSMVLCNAVNVPEQSIWEHVVYVKVAWRSSKVQGPAFAVIDSVTTLGSKGARTPTDAFLLLLLCWSRCPRSLRQMIFQLCSSSMTAERPDCDAKLPRATS